jgi:putative ATPase
VSRQKRSAPDGPTLLEHVLARGVGADGTRPPLADRMRPQSLDEIAGQTQLVGPGRWLRRVIEADRLVSLIFWGPPGVGKTTLGEVIARTTRRRFVPFSAVLGGVPELRVLLSTADEERRYKGLGTILFIDEIHRFNRAQQDALLPQVERGTVTLIGATTENPSFAVNAAVLSRAKVLRLDPLDAAALVPLLERALSDEARGLGGRRVLADVDALDAIARAAGGDARRALGLLEAAVEAHPDGGPPLHLTRGGVRELLADSPLLYDKAGDAHYDVTSALIKSLRGSDPDAAIYWLMRMLEAGDDPRFVLRRLLIFASEDVGNADPRALSLTIAADQAFARMGMPEGIYPIAHACLYLASCPKSGAVGKAWQRARELVHLHGSLPVPLHLRNAPTELLRTQGNAEGYRYAHDYPEGFVPGETYLPELLVGTRLYEPTSQGLEQSIRERLARIAEAGRRARGRDDAEQ